MRVVDQFDAVLYLFCFEWIRAERKVDWYRLDVLLIIEVEGVFI